MNENENENNLENVSRETSETPAEVIDYSQDLQSIKDAVQGLASPVGSIVTELQETNILLEQINGQMSYGYSITYFAFVLVMFEVLRFFKGLFKGVFKDD